MIAPVKTGVTHLCLPVYSCVPMGWDSKAQQWRPLVLDGGRYHLADGPGQRHEDWMTAAEVCAAAHHREVAELLGMLRRLERHLKEQTADATALEMAEKLRIGLTKARLEARRLVSGPMGGDKLSREVQAARHRKMSADELFVSCITDALIHAQAYTRQVLTDEGIARAAQLLYSLCEDMESKPAKRSRQKRKQRRRRGKQEGMD